MRYLLIILLFCAVPAQAQVKGGIKVGMNLSSIRGPVVNDSTGRESYRATTGFQVGPFINWKWTPVVGLRAELLYNQAGGRYEFDGVGFNIFRAEDGTKIVAYGPKKIILNVTNSYLHLPLLVYGRVGAFQVEAGIRPGLLVSSFGDGKLTFSGTTSGGTVVPEMEQELFFNYLRDKAGDADFNDVKQLILDGKLAKIPQRLKAYFFEDENKRLYTRFDLDVTVGAAYYFNRSLHIGVRAAFGLSDLTNNAADFDQIKTNGLNLIRSGDKDKLFQISLSVGFSM